MSRLRTGALAAACALLAGCGAGGAGGNYAWGWYVLDPFHPKGGSNLAFLLSGAGATLVISVGALSVSVIAGALLAVAGLSGNRVLRWLNRTYVEVFRAIPLLVLLLWIYYGLPTLLGIAFPVFWAGLVTLALSDAAFEAEIFRAGLQSVPKGQREAADTLGLSRWHAFRHIVLPQALRHIAPALGNQFVYVLKMSSLVSVIGFQELTRRANELNVTEYRPLEIYSFLVVEYLVLVLAASWGVRRLERRMAAAPH